MLPVRAVEILSAKLAQNRCTHLCTRQYAVPVCSITFLMTTCVDCGKPVMPGDYSRFDPDSLQWESKCESCIMKPAYDEAERRERHQHREANPNQNEQEYYRVICGVYD